MERAKVICNMLTSIDGKTQNSFRGSEDTRFASELYESLNYSLGQAVAVGRNTVDTGKRPNLSPFAGAKVEYKDKVLLDDCTYGIIFDRTGKMCWDGKYQTYADIPKRRIIEVLTEQVSPEYLAYLDSLEIPYLFGGKDDLDLELVLHKLKRDYGIETLVLNGGAALNTSFLRAGLMDELILIVAPGINGRTDALSFVRSDDPDDFPVFFQLKEVRQPGHNVLQLHYEKQTSV